MDNNFEGKMKMRLNLYISAVSIASACETSKKEIFSIIYTFFIVTQQL